MADEKKKTGHMSREEKVRYVWDYYKVPVLFLAAVIALILGVGWQLLFNNQKTVYNFAVVNEKMSVEGDIQLKESLSRWFGLDPRREEVTVDSGYNVPYIYNEDGQLVNVDGSPAADYSTFEKFFLNLSHNVIDAAVMPEGFLEYCNSLDRSYYDLTELFSQEELEPYKDRFCYGTDAYGEEYLCGLYTDGTIFDASYFAGSAGEELVKAYGKQVLVFPAGGQNPQYNVSFLKWVFEENALGQ